MILVENMRSSWGAPIEYSVLLAHLSSRLVEELGKAELRCRNYLRARIHIPISVAEPTALSIFSTACTYLGGFSRLKDGTLKHQLVLFFNLLEDLNELEVDGVCRAFLDVEG
jgi:hypothetical protein